MRASPILTNKELQVRWDANRSERERQRSRPSKGNWKFKHYVVLAINISKEKLKCKDALMVARVMPPSQFHGEWVGLVCLYSDWQIYVDLILGTASVILIWVNHCTVAAVVSNILGHLALIHMVEWMFVCMYGCISSFCTQNVCSKHQSTMTIKCFYKINCLAEHIQHT